MISTGGLNGTRETKESHASLVSFLRNTAHEHLRKKAAAEPPDGKSTRKILMVATETRGMTPSQVKGDNEEEKEQEEEAVFSGAEAEA